MTQRHEAVTELRRFLDATSDGFVALRDGMVIECNLQVAELVGAPVEEIVGAALHEVLGLARHRVQVVSRFSAPPLFPSSAAARSFPYASHLSGTV